MAEVQELESPEVGELEVVSAQIEEQQAQEPAQAAPEDDTPEEFKGMSQSELARLVKHARREMGKQANELGEIRKLADELIRSQLQPKQQEAEKPKTDFFENPDEAVSERIQSHPDVIAAKQYAVQAQQAMAKQQLAQMHPDFQQVIADQEFGQWVGASPVRQKLLQAADRYDLAAANELLSTFKELKKYRTQQVSTTETKAIDKSIKAAAVETGGSGESSKKVYRRADLIRLKMSDPSRYESMQDEIMSAYASGRVR